MPRVLDLFAVVEAERPDVLHLYWGHYPSLLSLLVTHYLPTIPVSHSLGAYDLEMGYGCSGPAARQAAVVWSLAKANNPAIERLGVAPTRIALCYDGIEMPRDASEPQPKVAQRIVVAERLIASKRTDDSLHVFKLVLDSFPGASLVVLGDGPARPALEEQARALGIDGQVTFAGHRGHDEVFQNFSAATVMLTMTRHPSERLPNAVKEAMARGCICMVTRTPGIQELLGDGVEGFVVEPGDTLAAAQHICEIFADPRAASGMAHRSYGKIAEHFDIDKLTARRCARWRELIAQRQDTAAAGPDR